jgi:hypothetical protein
MVNYRDRKDLNSLTHGMESDSSVHAELRIIAQLQDENERLRRIAADLLLEKMKLEEAVMSRATK